MPKPCLTSPLLSLSSSSNIDEEWCSNDELSDEYEIDESSVDDEHPSSTSGPRVKKHVNKGRWTKDEDEVRDTRPREESLRRRVSSVSAKEILFVVFGDVDKEITYVHIYSCTCRLYILYVVRIYTMHTHVGM